MKEVEDEDECASQVSFYLIAYNYEHSGFLSLYMENIFYIIINCLNIKEKKPILIIG